MNSFPVAEAVCVSTPKSTYKLIVPCCPMCKKKHSHGCASFGTDGGVRMSHCVSNSRMYKLVITNK